MILETTTDLKKYLSISQNFDFVDFQPYLLKAKNSFTKKYVGSLDVTLAIAASGANEIIINEAREHLRNALANFGYFLYLPYASVQLDSSGISVVSSDQRKNAEWWQINDIRRELLRSGHEAMDLLLEVLEANPTNFPTWTSNFNTQNHELLVHNTSDFNKYYHIFNSRQTFLALQPSIRQVEDQYIKTMLCPELIEAMKSTASGNVLALKESMQKAIVAFTVAKVASVGLFQLDENGLRINFDTLISGRKESASYGKTVDQMTALVNEQINNGTQYLKIAKDIILQNPTDFTQCVNPLIKSKISGSGYSAYDTRGVLAL
jgi:hypothetical protein